MAHIVRNEGGGYPVLRQWIEDRFTGSAEKFDYFTPAQLGLVMLMDKNEITEGNDHAVYALDTNADKITLRFSKWLSIAKFLHKKMTTGINRWSRDPAFKGADPANIQKVQKCYHALDASRDWTAYNVDPQTCQERCVLIKQWFDAWSVLQEFADQSIKALFSEALRNVQRVS